MLHYSISCGSNNDESGNFNWYGGRNYFRSSVNPIHCKDYVSPTTTKPYTSSANKSYTEVKLFGFGSILVRITLAMLMVNQGKIFLYNYL